MVSLDNRKGVDPDMKDEDFKNKDEHKNRMITKLGMIDFTKKSFWIVVLIYSAIVLTLKYKFNSKVGEFLYQLSFFALIFGVVFVIYRVIKFIIIDVKNRYFEK